MTTNHKATNYERRYWFEEQRSSKKGLIPLLLSYDQDLRPSLLRRAVEAVLTENPALRKKYKVIDGDLCYEFASSSTQIVFSEINLLSEEEVTNDFNHHIKEQLSGSNVPGLQVRLYQSGSVSWIGLLFSHMSVDAWSSQRILNDLFARYETLHNGGCLTEKSEAHYDNEYLESCEKFDSFKWENIEGEENYWASMLAGAKTLKSRRVVLPRSRESSTVTATHALPSELLQFIELKSKDMGVTRNSFALACYAILLRGLTEETDFVVGVPVLDRNISESDNLVDNRVGLLPIRVKFKTEMLFSDFAKNIHLQISESFDHPSVYETDTLKELDKELLSPKVIFSPQPNRPQFKLNGKDLKVHALQTSVQINQELILSLGESSITWWACAKKFDEKYFELLSERFLDILTEASRTNNQSVNSLCRLSKKDKTIIDQNSASPHPLYERSLLDLFLQQVARNPEQTAIDTVNGKQLSYQELDKWASAIAVHLKNNGVAARDRIGIHLLRSAEYIAAILACVKIGAVYVPLDPSHPIERIQYIQQDADLKSVITADGLENSALRSVVSLASVGELDETISSVFQEEFTGPDELAYLMYTSGSTGQPKGVQVPYRGIIRLCMNTNYINIVKGDRIPFLSSLCFDASTFELWGPLLNGGTIVVPDKSLLGFRDFENCFLKYRVSKAFITTSLFNALVDYNPALFFHAQTLLVGGEVMSVEHASRFRKNNSHTMLINVYGPTENTTFSTFHIVADADYTGPIPIGKSITGTGTYIMDEEGSPAMIGVPGEICLTGFGVAHGYNNDAVKTAESFVSNRMEKSGNQMYRTGDYGLMLSNGEIEYLGRRDRQVKVRGFRIELAELEDVIRRHGSVMSAVCRMIETEDLNKLVVAYVTAKVQVEDSVILGWCRKRLPQQMVPSKIVFLDEIPLNHNGKVDETRLPNPYRVASKGPRDWGDMNPECREFTDLLAICLGTSELDPQLGFHEHGGNSLMLTKLISQVESKLGVKLPIEEMANFSTLNEMLDCFRSRLDKKSKPHGGYNPFRALKQNIQPSTELDVNSYRIKGNKVLVTGANGYVGCHLVNALLEAGAKKVFCLIRCESHAHGRVRLMQAFNKYCIKDILWDRIEVIPGDLGAPQLGMDDSTYDRCATEVDSIMHNGAWVNFLYPSRALEEVNVYGTERILELAVKHRLKPVHYVSTLSVFNSAHHSGKGAIPEHFDVPVPPDDPDDGYSMTKWMAESFIVQASKRRVPASIFRLSRIVWDSKSCVGNSDDYFSRLLVGSLSEGIFPRASDCVGLGQNLTPTDLLAKAIVHISSQPNSNGKAFHMVNSRTIENSEFLGRIRRFDPTIKEVAGEEWETRVFGAARKSETHPLFPFAISKSAFNGFHTSTREFGSSNKEEFLSPTGNDLDFTEHQMFRFLGNLRHDWNCMERTTL